MDITCYVRVFDLDKFREILPIVRSIYNRSADPDLVTSLITEAIDKIESDEFKQYHDESIQEDYRDDLQSALKLFHSGRLLESSIEETIERIIKLLCHPKYQESIDNLNSVSENIAEYSDIYGYWYGFNKFLHELINNESPEHSAPYLFASGGISISILETDVLTDITKMVIEDLANLSQPDWILYSVETHWYDGELSEFEKAEEKKYGIIDRQVEDGTLLLDDLKGYYIMRAFSVLIAESRRHKVSNRRYNMFPKISPPKNLDDGDVAIAIPEIQDELITFY